MTDNELMKLTKKELIEKFRSTQADYFDLKVERNKLTDKFSRKDRDLDLIRKEIINAGFEVREIDNDFAFNRTIISINSIFKNDTKIFKLILGDV